MAIRSVYELLTPLSVIRKQKFWDYFDGDSLRNWWAAGAATGSTTMSDTVDGGLILTTGTTTNNAQEHDFNDINHYAQSASIFLCVMKANATASQAVQYGSYGDATFAHYSLIESFSGNTNYKIITNDGVTPTGTEGSTAIDTNWHFFKIENTSSSANMWIDGVLEAVHTSNLPAVDLQPLIRVKTTTTAAKSGQFRYFEAYNT